MTAVIVRTGVIALALAFSGPLAALAQRDVPDDRGIERTVREMILDDPLMRRSRHVTVESKGGEVWLKGYVDSLIDKMQAGIYAENTEGVIEVHNCLRVKHRWPWEDDACGRNCGDTLDQQELY